MARTALIVFGVPRETLKLVFPQRHPGNGCFVFTIEESSSGAEIGKFSEFKEAELIFLPNQPLMVSGISEGEVLKRNNVEYCRTFEVTLKEIK